MAASTASVQRRERDKNDPAEIDPTLEGDAVLHFVTDPAERCALRQDGNERHPDPGGDGERGKRRSAGDGELANLRGGAGIQRQKKRRGERGDGEKEGADGGAIGFGPELRDG